MNSESSDLIVRKFERRVADCPSALAVVVGDARAEKLTYAQLNARANQLAWKLRDCGVRPNTVVGLMAERSLEMIVGAFAILKAGGAYLPLSPEGPRDRIEYMLHEAGAPLLLKQAGLDGLDIPTLDLRDLMHYAGRSDDPETAVTGRDLAYVIYTSGSTGRPKGVMIEHRSLANRLEWMQSAYPLSPEDVILQKTPYFFDVSVWELFWWSFAGASVCMLAPGFERFPQAIVETVERHRVTTLHFVPSMLGAFLKYVEGTDRLSSLRRVFASGESLTPTHVKLFARTVGRGGARLTNLYGPTEATVDVTFFDCSADGELEKVPIGKAIDGIEMLVLDEHDRPAGVAQPGEICIAGVGVARGYINDAEATAKSFVPHPIRPDERIYRTGDLGQWLPDGNLEFLGRRDRQVKVRGIRIELEEIEAAIESYSEVREVVVVVVTSSETVMNLVAYFTHFPDLDVGRLKSSLAAMLPSYMIPTKFVALDELPRNGSGKVDRGAVHRLAATGGVAP